MYQQPMTLLHRGILSLLLAVFAAITMSDVARADFGVQPGSFQSAVLDATGAVDPAPQAGAHPFAQQVKFALNTINHSYPAGTISPPSGPDPDPDGAVKTIITDLPAGFIGNPQAVPRCEQSDFPPAFFFGASRCPDVDAGRGRFLDLGSGSGFPIRPATSRWRSTTWCRRRAWWRAWGWWRWRRSSSTSACGPAATMASPRRFATSPRRRTSTRAP